MLQVDLCRDSHTHKHTVMTDDYSLGTQKETIDTRPSVSKHGEGRSVPGKMHC